MARMPCDGSSYSEITIQNDDGTGMRPTCFAGGDVKTGPTCTQTTP